MGGQEFLRGFVRNSSDVLNVAKAMGVNSFIGEKNLRY